MAKRIRVYLVAYHLSDGKKVWVHESMGKKEAFDEAGKLAIDGFKAVVYRFKVKPSTLMSSLPLHSTHTVTRDSDSFLEHLVAESKRVAKKAKDALNEVNESLREQKEAAEDADNIFDRMAANEVPIEIKTGHPLTRDQIDQTLSLFEKNARVATPVGEN